MKIVFIDDVRQLMLYPQFDIPKASLPNKKDEVIFHNLPVTFEVRKVTHNYPEDLVEVYIYAESVSPNKMKEAGFEDMIIYRSSDHRELPYS